MYLIPWSFRSLNPGIGILYIFMLDLGELLPNLQILAHYL